MKVSGRWLNPSSALERGLRILDILAREKGEMSFTELTRQMDNINPASLSRTLKQLVELGFVQKHPLSGQYLCGYRCAVFSDVRSLRRQDYLLERYGAFQEELAREFDLTVILFERVQQAMLNIRKVQTAESINMQDEATVSDTLTFPWVRILAAHDDHARKALGMAVEEAERLRQFGHVYDDREIYSYCRRLAVAIFDHNGEVIGALGVGGTILHITDENVGQIIARVKAGIMAIDGTCQPVQIAD